MKKESSGANLAMLIDGAHKELESATQTQRKMCVCGCIIYIIWTKADGLISKLAVYK